MRTWIDVAVLAKTKNSKGRFVVRSTAGLPFLLEEGDEVAFVPPQTDAPRNARILDVRFIDEDSADVAFEGIETLDLAQKLAGCHCLILRELVDESVFRDSPATWEGWKVLDDDLGEVGCVAGFVDKPLQPLLELKRPDGAIALVPVADEIVYEVDVSKSLVRTRLPIGLLEL